MVGGGTSGEGAEKILSTSEVAVVLYSDGVYSSDLTCFFLPTPKARLAWWREVMGLTPGLGSELSDRVFGFSTLCSDLHIAGSDPMARCEKSPAMKERDGRLISGGAVSVGFDGREVWH